MRAYLKSICLAATQFKGLVLLAILVIASCAPSVPLTEEQREERQYADQERRLAYFRWEASCFEQKGVVYAYNPQRPCGGRRGCVPHKWDWDYDFERERPRVGNIYTCVSREQLRRAL